MVTIAAAPEPIGGFADLTAQATSVSGKRVGLQSQTDSFDKTAIVGLGPNMQSGHALLCRIASRDPVFSQLAGVYGQSDQLGVVGLTTTNEGTGVYGGNVSSAISKGVGIRGETTGGVGVQGRSFGSGLAGRFIGNVQIESGDLQLSGVLTCNDVTLADCSEHFEIAGSLPDPGSVMCIGDDGKLALSTRKYDKRVAGIVSGAGSYKSGLVLGKPSDDRISSAIALIGKVYCLVDASHAPIEIGDLLTTSDVAGHAMKAMDSYRAFGAVIGKALAPLSVGSGLVPVLVALQ